MGLDATGYSDAKKENLIYDPETDEYTGKGYSTDKRLVDVWKNPAFPEHALDIEEGVYSVQKTKAVSHSYSGFGYFREQLARITGEYTVHPKGYLYSAWEAKSGPFWMFLNFSDCEGVIGTKVSQLLYQDFEAYKETAGSVNDPFFYEKYKTWLEIFKLASDNGFVDFH